MVTIITLVLLFLMLLGNSIATFIFFALIAAYNTLKVRQGYLVRKTDPIEWHKTIIVNGGLILIVTIFLFATLR